MPHDPARVAAVAALGGSIALQISDREYGDTYRYVFTFGGGPAAFEQASSTVEVDADDLAALAVARTPPLQVMVSGKLRIRGDADLPQRALGLLLAR
jgi:putative sterol carrier protein